MEIIPAEAHLQMSRIERKIATLRDAANDLYERVADTSSAAEVMGKVCAAANELERANGFSPVQRMTGRSPNVLTQLGREWGNMPLLDAETSGCDPLTQQLERQSEAHQAFVRAQASARLKRAALPRHRTTAIFEVGDLVYYWRKMVGRHIPHDRRGAWLGPARVLATEGDRAGTHPKRGGSAASGSFPPAASSAAPPSSSARRRPQSESPKNSDAPLESERTRGWTFQRVVQGARSGEYVDIRDGARPPGASEM